MTDPEGVVRSAPEPRNLPTGGDRPPRSHRGWVYTLIVLGAVVMLIAGLGTWVKRQALDTEKWVDASDELLADPQVRAALSRFIADELFQFVDVTAELGDRLPENLQGVAGPLAAAFQESAPTIVDRLLAREGFQTIWTEVNRRAHGALVSALRDETPDAVSTGGGVVTLDLGEFVRNLGSRLGLSQAAIERIPADVGQVTLIRSDRLAGAQAAVTAVEWASVLLFLLVLALFVAAVALARGWRRVALRDVGLAVVVVGLVFLVLQRLAGRYIVDNFVTVQDNRDVAASVWAIGTELLREIGLNSIAVGIVVVLAAALAGPGRVALQIRRFISPLFAGNPAALWGVVAAVYLLIVLWSPLPALETWWGALIGAALVGVAIEGLRRVSERDGTALLDNHDIGWTAGGDGRDVNP